MKNSNRFKILIIFFVSTFLISCGKKDNNIDFDFSTLKKSKKVKISTKNIKETKEIFDLDNNILIQDLVPLKDKQEILSKTKFGKKDPFSEAEIQSNKLNSDFKLTGFLNTEINKYVFVSFLDKEGTITEDSIGGLNTNLLPNGAKVISIDTKNMKLIINFENENFIFEM